jgi:NAD(P)-dependent dehydrogenase (short-subunit alcohol dehydrogenase family)
MFKEKTAVITGASSGLGAALALKLAGAGANLGLFSPEREQQEEVAGRCRETGGNALAIIGDVTQPADCRRLIEETAARFGNIDYLIANAGISMWAPFEQVDDLKVFRRLMEVNYLGAVHCIHYALPHLRKRRGMVVAITSIQGRIGVPMHTGYVASKHALQGFCETLRMELKGSGVDILTVLPHWLRGTELRQRAIGADGKKLGGASRQHSSESISLETACTAIVQAIVRRRRELIIPAKLKGLLALNQFFPKWAEALIENAVDKQNR